MIQLDDARDTREGYTTQVVVFERPAYGKGTQNLHQYRVLEEDGTPVQGTAGVRCFAGRVGNAFKKRGYDVPGAMYTLKKADDGSGFASGRYIGMHPDTSYVRRVQALCLAWKAEIEAGKAEKKAKRSGHLFDPLQPLHEAYTRASGVGKRALLLDVIKYVQTGRR